MDPAGVPPKTPVRLTLRACQVLSRPTLFLSHASDKRGILTAASGPHSGLDKLAWPRDRQTNHCESDVGSLEGWSVIGAVSGDSDNLA